ncbi:hybrid sensor histidine kinase/response regulator [Sphingomonas sp. BK069]|uniref:hybrid sensor histidine kinase/response regulator n=1 Tax=Sphingomonas sp. BK069 TaxID=2586979 RepID=UPI00181E281A|nr:hybrid sensor histidine kinase/response regulator [Sphingomonas sp. BK069]MBB3349224.1 nitrogen-specific signal transduction histidine kinase/CheY-like chemotaxis protein [Sphingomonas sp. BK069]
MTAAADPTDGAPLDAEPAAHARALAELQRARESAEAANEAKTRYLVAVSHEIRSPLNVIYGYAQLLERDHHLSGAEAGTIIRRSAEHVTNLVEGLLEISRIESGVLTIRQDLVDLRALLQHVVDMFRMQASARGLTLTLDVRDRLPDQVKADEKRLRQILINLVSNAIKYTPAGHVTLAVRYRSQVADIEVIDTGIGIPPEDLERVFEPFDRGSLAAAQRQPGIGLGLAITRVLARVLGGDVAVTSTPGIGSVFRFRAMLPSIATPARSRGARGRIIGYEGPRRTVLVIDDDPSQRHILRALLGGLDFVVHVAADGTEGIALAAEVTPDVVLLDIQMPGLNGWQVAERLRAAHGAPLRIVMVSADAHAFRAGGDGRSSHDAFVTKPVELDTLVAVIGAQLGLRWEEASPVAPVAPPDAPAPQTGLPPEAAPLLARVRELTEVGHVRGVGRAIDDLAAAIPAAGTLAAVLRRQLGDFDLRALLGTIDDATR